MKAYIIAVIMILLSHRTDEAVGQCYSAWTDTGIHLIMCDNGTPDDVEDDYVVDWEDNRVFSIKVYD